MPARSAPAAPCPTSPQGAWGCLGCRQIPRSELSASPRKVWGQRSGSPPWRAGARLAAGAPLPCLRSGAHARHA
eukprot:14981474-Heterocapsa_arctica.AAC.1